MLNAPPCADKNPLMIKVNNRLLNHQTPSSSSASENRRHHSLKMSITDLGLLISPLSSEVN